MPLIWIIIAILFAAGVGTAAFAFGSDSGERDIKSEALQRGFATYDSVSGFAWRESFRSCASRAAVAGFILFGQSWKDGRMSKTIKMGDAAGNATAHFADAAGAEHPIYSVPVWAAAPDGVVTLTPAADGKTCAYAAVAPGTVTITAVAECDPTAGTNTVTLSASLTVIDVEDTGGTIDLG